MKKFLKLMLGIGGCLFYYIVVCALLDIDVYDPWDKIIKWARGEKKEKINSADDLFEENDEWSDSSF